MSPEEVITRVEKCRTRPGADCFLELQRAFTPLTPITTRAQYDKAMQVAGTLASLSRLPPPAAQYLEVLARNIEAYERNRFASAHDPLENLRFLLSENGLSASDLGRLLGHRELGSKILKRQRQLTVGHIRKLAEYFRVSPGTFV
jgi:HTH-type transcriptional regulator / antitoxin HigA